MRPTPDPSPDKKFGTLSFVSSDIGPNGRIWWTLRCERGHIFRRRAHSVLTGSMRCRICTRSGSDHPLWTGHGELNGAFFALIKQNAKTRNIPFEITIQQLWDLFVNQGGKCALTGLTLNIANCGKAKPPTPGTASLDRIDSSIGYIISNLWWVHKDANCMKMDYPLTRFIEICRLVAARFPVTPTEDMDDDIIPITDDANSYYVTYDDMS